MKVKRTREVAKQLPLLDYRIECKRCRGNGCDPDAMEHCWVNCRRCGGRGWVYSSEEVYK